MSPLVCQADVRPRSHRRTSVHNLHSRFWTLRTVLADWLCATAISVGRDSDDIGYVREAFKLSQENQEARPCGGLDPVGGKGWSGLL